MDYSLLMVFGGIILVSIFLLAIRMKLGGRLSRAELKGIEGEQKVSSILKKHKVKHFDDVLLQLGATSTQIDHIVVFPNKRILVIETKNKDGKFYGDATQKQWTQQFPNTTYQFYNPILQNEGHIRFLKRFCEKHKLRGYEFVNLVVFTGERTELVDVPGNVVTHHQLPYVLKKFSSKSMFNRSSKFASIFARSDLSKNKAKVSEHLKFIEQAKKHNKKKNKW